MKKLKNSITNYLKMLLLILQNKIIKLIKMIKMNLIAVLILQNKIKNNKINFNMMNHLKTLYKEQKIKN